MPIRISSSYPASGVRARIVMFAALGIALTGASPLVRAQAAPAPAAPAPAIAAASVRWVCNDWITCRGKLPNNLVVDPVRFSASADEVAAEVPLAYGLTWVQTKGLPDWAGQDRYQIEISVASPVSRTQMEQVLLRKVLDQCFSIRANTIARSVPGFALVVVPGGITFKAAKAPPPRQAPRVFEGIMTISSLPQLVAILNRFYYNGKRYGVTRPVTDATGLAGSYAIPFPAPGSLQPEANLLAALRPLGLQVKPAPVIDTRLQIQHIDYLRTSCTLGPEPAHPQN